MTTTVRKLIAAGIAALLALAASVASSAEATLDCGEHASHWDAGVVACPAPGRMYPQEGTWRDGTVVTLRGFSYTTSNGFPTTAISEYWFTEAGQYLPGRKSALIRPLDGTSLQIGPDGTFRGVMYSQPASIIPPGRYRILFRASVPCRPPGDPWCDTQPRPVTLPAGFDVTVGRDPPELSHDSSLRRSEFAWAAIEVLAGQRPEPEPGTYRLICQPLGSDCVAGGAFYFETGGPSRYLRTGTGCINFYRRIAEGRYGAAERATLTDQKGMSVYGARNYRLAGHGRLPDSGTWQARFECHSGEPVVLGEYALAAPIEPVEPAKEPPGIITVDLTPPLAVRTEVDFARPQAGAIYAGDELIARLPPEVTHVSSLSDSIGSLATTRSASRCSLRAWQTGTRSIQMLGKPSQWYLEGRVRFAGASAVPVPPIAVQARLPAGLAPGAYQLELFCPDSVYHRVARPLLAKTTQAFEVLAPRRPTAVLRVPPPRTSGNPQVDRLWRCVLCNGDSYRLTIGGLEAGDVLVQARWGRNGDLGCAPRNALCQDDFPLIGYERAAAGDILVLEGRIPTEADRDFQQYHALEITLRDRRNRIYTIPDRDLIVEPAPLDPEGLRRGFNFYRACAAYDAAEMPLIEQIDPEADLSGAAPLRLRARGFECLSNSVTVRLEAREPVPLNQTVATLTASAEGVAGGELVLAQLLDQDWQRQLRAPVVARLTIGTSAERAASADITLLPPVALAVTPSDPLAGQRIGIAWKGFTANSSAVLYLDDTVLKERVLLDPGDALITVQLPEALTGRYLLTMRDASGREAQAPLEIRGDPDAGRLCRQPCLHLPASTQQGDEIRIGYGGFPSLAQVEFALGGYTFRSAYQSTLMDSLNFVIPGGLEDGRYRISAQSGAHAAEAEISVRGNRRISLLAQPVTPGADPVRYQPGVHSVHVEGSGWFQRGRFSATLLGLDPDQPDGYDRRRSYALADYRDGCVVDIERYRGAPCDQRTGEIRQFWPIPASSAAGAYVLLLSDGLTESITENIFLVGETPVQPVVKRTDPPPVKRDEPEPDVRPCNPNMPRYAQPGCIDADTDEDRGDERQVAQRCDPNRPRYAQPGCIDADAGGDGGGEKQEVRKCDPNVPAYAQPGCRP